MGNSRTKKKIELTPEEIMIYSSFQSGVPVSQIAKESGRHRATIHRWINKIRAHFEEQGFDIDEFRKPLHGLYALWLKSVMINLEQCDPAFTTAHGKGMSYYQDKQEIIDSDSIGRAELDELRNELRSIGAVFVAVSDTQSDEDNQGTKTPN